MEDDAEFGDDIDEDHGPLDVKDSVEKTKMSKYLPNKSKKNSKNKHITAVKLEKALEKLNKRSA